MQIKDSVLRDSGIRPAFPPLRSGVRISVMARRPFRVVRLSGIRFWKDVRTAFLTPSDDSDCQQLVNNLSRELYVVDFRRVFRPSKKVRKFWENGLIFQKVMHGVPKHRNDTAFMLKTR